MKILFIHNSLSSFVQTDLNILRSTHDVQELYFRRDLHHVVPSLWQAFHGVLWSDMVFSWFAGFHALLPFVLAKLLGKKRVVIASGYDIANVPEIKYGSMRPGPRRIVGNLILFLSDGIFAVSEFTAYELARNARADASKVKIIQHGFPITDPIDVSKKVISVVTISTVSREHVRLKGLDVFAQSARLIPEVKFTLIGPIIDDMGEYLKSISPSNLELAGYVQDAFHSELIKTAKVYAQLSLYESFGCGLAEAMMQGCIPVVTSCGALPEVVGDTGFIVPYNNPEATAQAIQQALNSGPEQAHRARQRIIEHFPLEKRKRLLLEAIDEVARL